MAVSEEESSSSSSAGCSSKSRSAAPRGASYLAKTVLRGSVVLQVVYGRIRSSTSYDVVLGKETSVELVIIDEDGIVQSICEQPVFGIIKDIAVLPWNEKFRAGSPQLLSKDLLVVISDSGKLSVLRFCNEMHRFFAVTHVQLSSPGNPRHQIGRMLAIDSSGCFIAASAYEDRLALFSRSASAGSDILDKRIFCPTDNQGKIGTASGFTSICGTIWSMCFISTDVRQPNKEHNPVLAILLNRRRSYRTELMLIEWNMKEHSLHVIYQYSEPGPLAHHIIEVPHSYGILLVFRAGDAIVMDFRDPHNPCFLYRISLNFTPPSVEEQNFVEEAIRIPDIIDEDGMYSVAASALLELSDLNKNDPMNIDDDSNVKPGSNFVCSWSWNPGNEHSPRMIFCADSGELFLIDFLFDSDGLKISLSDCLYKTQPAKALLWVRGGFLAVIIEMGDGMVLKVEEGKLVYRSPIQNIAPILDMSVVDYHDEKHDQMFACCGMAPEGSLRVIRSGISVEKLLKTAPIYQGITGTWTVKMKMADSYHSFLVLSFVEETRVLSVGVSFSDVTDFMGFQPDVCTLACGLVGDGLLVQIHQTAVRLCVPTIFKSFTCFLKIWLCFTDNSSPECNLALTCSFYMGEIAMRVRKGSFSYKLPADDALKGCQVASNVGDISQNSIMASTLLGSIIIFIPLTREEYDLLEAVQARLVIHPLTAPILGNDHAEFRCRGSLARAPKALDGDMLAQFLELTSMQQEAVLALPLGAQNTITFNSKQSPPPITVNQVVRLLERVHYALN
uniref:Splicing factor 3B subunit 3 n=1 Tax=Nicotiana tabacum TaxID=4097 RepID=A0A1S3YEL6_TOBAC|nr:PREDICTED: splicing factor 3B subunit 3-like [Nicotiana tabacum]